MNAINLLSRQFKEIYYMELMHRATRVATTEQVILVCGSERVGDSLEPRAQRFEVVERRGGVFTLEPEILPSWYNINGWYDINGNHSTLISYAGEKGTMGEMLHSNKHGMIYKRLDARSISPPSIQHLLNKN